MLEINLAELQRTLDAQGIEVVDNQKESVIGRKALADKTKGAAVVRAYKECAHISFKNLKRYPIRRN